MPDADTRLNTRSNSHIWKFCLASAIIVTILGITDIVLQIANYWNQYQWGLNTIQSSMSPIQQASIQDQLPHIIQSGIYSVSLVIVTFFFIVSAFVITSILFKRLATSSEKQRVEAKNDQFQDEEGEHNDLQVEIVDLPRSTHH